MAYSKAQIYNLALGMLLLGRQVTDTENDKSNEAKVLNTHWPVAFSSTLEDLDLDATSTQVNGSLLAQNPTTQWNYVYQYPVDCAFLRRIQSSVKRDNRYSHIPKKIGIWAGQRAVFTNAETPCVFEYISTDISISLLSANACLAIAAKLAMLSAPLITGKGAKTLMDSIMEKYKFFKMEAQEQDRRENYQFFDEEVESEFVIERTGAWR